MDASRHQSWVRVALLVGVVYLLIGRIFAAPTTHVRAWRLGAWLVSGAAYGIHIGYEQFRLRNSPRFVAFHAAVAVAIGAFALALAGAVRSLLTTSAIRPLWLLAFVLWPAATAVPAFLVALIVAVMLARLPHGRR